MPTGYTAGIIDGEITTFEQFAKQCARAFGATVHMRDDDMKAPYVKREPSDYHSKAIAVAEQQYNESKTIPDAELIANKKAELLKSRAYHVEALEKSKVGYERMNAILQRAYAYEPPTPEHDGIKSFMIQQLTETIKHDFEWSDKYHNGKLKEIDEALKSINPESVRREMASSAIKNIAYHEKEYNQEVLRCNESNQWVDLFFKSIDSSLEIIH